MNPRVAIVIVNWNGWEDTLTCLESILRVPIPCCRTIVVDNGSRNDSVTRIREWAAPGRKTAPVTLVSYDRETAEQGGSPLGERALNAAGTGSLAVIETGANLGFAGGNNIGIRYARAWGAKYILLLNNDAFISSPDALPAMIEFMERTPRAGACGGRLLYPGGDPQQSYGHFPAVPRTLAALFPLYRLLPSKWLKGVKRSNVVPDRKIREPLQVDWPSGACLMVRTEAVAEVGMLDERYFLYMEETDWCLRMKVRGWDRYYVPQAEVVHAFGGSVGKTSTPMKAYHLESQFTYYRKHFSPAGLATVAAAYLLRSCFAIGWIGLSSVFARRGNAASSPEAAYWQQARRLAAAALGSFIPTGKPRRIPPTAASAAVRFT
ncbi:glycosyltransferase family 2 protein [Geobacter sp. DSM 9736]|uniref:glycosyltransferase family 2 protein n=1 Tax=Geobacter sp. DSM 9736 TaxID=1277350 RepID=UPI000B50E6CF|nr:glycosyltransferase family 2 protein [Geobacter sp. DSM 9736]SNB47968.1 hypothetical protein SAMN06269301_3462 [Geobacter sp. DSM 9736]